MSNLHNIYIVAMKSSKDFDEFISNFKIAPMQELYNNAYGDMLEEGFIEGYKTANNPILLQDLLDFTNLKRTQLNKKQSEIQKKLDYLQEYTNGSYGKPNADVISDISGEIKELMKEEKLITNNIENLARTTLNMSLNEPKRENDVYEVSIERSDSEVER